MAVCAALSESLLQLTARVPEFLAFLFDQGATDGYSRERSEKGGSILRPFLSLCS